MVTVRYNLLKSSRIKRHTAPAILFVLRGSIDVCPCIFVPVYGSKAEKGKRARITRIPVQAHVGNAFFPQPPCPDRNQAYLAWCVIPRHVPVEHELPPNWGSLSQRYSWRQQDKRIQVQWTSGQIFALAGQRSIAEYYHLGHNFLGKHSTMLNGDLHRWLGLDLSPPLRVLG